MSTAREMAAVATALGLYRRVVAPRTRRELRRWEGVAAAISDPVLRSHALAALREKGGNAEATAVFAILAPRASRDRALRAIVALQVAIDYLDTLGEQPAEEPLAAGLALHEALPDALSPGEPPSDWYRLHPHVEDGGYLAALVTECGRAVALLPAWEAVAPAARQAARRCGEGQSRTHAAAAETRAGGSAAPVETPTGTCAAAAGPAAAGLQSWAEGLDAPPGYLWWEVAAGACSSVAAHALIAAAADPHTTAAEAALIDAAYFPPIGALTVLLDDLLDRDADLAAGEHNYLTHYADGEAAADRLALIAARARAATAPLRHARRHRAILAGVAAFYLSPPAARGGYARPIRERLLESFDPTVRPIAVAMRLRRRG